MKIEFKTVRDLRRLYVSKESIKYYIMVWEHDGERTFKANVKGESTLEDYINKYEEFESYDSEELELNSNCKRYKVKDIVIDDNNKEIRLVCISDEPNKQIKKLIECIKVFKYNTDNLIQELECFADNYKEDEEITLQELLDDFSTEFSYWNQ